MVRGASCPPARVFRPGDVLTGAQAYINGGQSLRYCNAVGLTKAEPFKTPVPRKITHGKKEELLPAPLSAVDEEARRHLFWLGAHARFVAVGGRGRGG